jgi:hypothetical protein
MNETRPVSSYTHLEYLQEPLIDLHKPTDPTAKRTRNTRRTRTSNDTISSKLDANQRASSTDIISLLDAPSNQTCPSGSKTMTFRESGIIASRKNKAHKKAKDYLVEALPVWRRAGVDGGPEPGHIDAWEAMTEDRGFHLESEKYNFIVQRMHPRFGEWTGADEVFARGLEQQDGGGRDDGRDREKAMEMLGYLIERVGEEVDEEIRGWLLDHWGGVFADTTNSPTTPREATTRGWKFLIDVPPRARRVIGSALIFGKAAPSLSVWTNALCIAILPPWMILQAWKMHGIKERPKRYRAAITAFLEQYHDDGIHNTESFIYVLRTYYTLTSMLRQPVEDTRGSKYYEPWGKDGSEYGSDVHEDIEEECTRKGPDSDYDGNTSSGDDEDDDKSEPETEETRMKGIEEAAKRDVEQGALGRRVTRGHKRTLEAYSGDKRENEERDMTGAEEDSENKKTKI